MKRFLSVLLALTLMLTATCALAVSQTTSVTTNVDTAILPASLTDMNEADVTALNALIALLNASETTIIWDEGRLSLASVLSGTELFTLDSVRDEAGTRLKTSLFPSYVLSMNNMDSGGDDFAPSAAQTLLESKLVSETGAFAVGDDNYTLHKSLRLTHHECLILLKDALENADVASEISQTVAQRLEGGLAEPDFDCLSYDLYRSETSSLITLSIDNTEGTWLSLSGSLMPSQNVIAAFDAGSLPGFVLNDSDPNATAQALMDDFVGLGIDSIVNAGIVDYPAETSAFMDWITNQQLGESNIDFTSLTSIAAYLSQDVLPSLLSTSTTPAYERYVVIGDRVNLRQGPGTDTAIVGHARKGDAMDVYAIEGSWARCMKDGEAFYIAVKLIKKAD